MNDRTRAIDILIRARDLLAEQLTDRVLQGSDGILEDALGMSYTSEIDTIYEQLGARLAHLNALIANLPPAREPAAEEQTGESQPTAADVMVANAANTVGGLLALPAPRASYGLPVPLDPARLQALTLAVSGVSAPGRMLAELFGIAPERGAHCWRHFLSRLEREPQLSLRAAQLLGVIEAGNIGGALVLLWECFGLRGPESYGALQSLKERILA